jgi:uncharacterized protein YjiS (DUF1127 family)
MFYDTASHRPGFMTIAMRPWQLLANLMLERRTRTTLSGLSDHQLKDIGISRGEIERVSRNTGPARLTRLGK